MYTPNFNTNMYLEMKIRAAQCFLLFGKKFPKACDIVRFAGAHGGREPLERVWLETSRLRILGYAGMP